MGYISMKKILKKFIALTLVVMAITAFSGCDNGSSSSQPETAVPTTAESNTVEPTTVDPVFLDIKADLNSLHDYDKENGDELAGAWQITGGSGDQFENFVYTFDGKGKAMLALGNMSYLSDYTIDESYKTVEIRLVFGLNGQYNYEFSEDKDFVILENTEDGSTTKIEKLEDFSMIPAFEESPKVNEKLLGAWLSENGEYIYFGADGIMYQNLYDVSIIYSNYSVDDDVITSKYSMQNENMIDTYEYTVDNKVLTMNGEIYNRIPASELV